MRAVLEKPNRALLVERFDAAYLAEVSPSGQEMAGSAGVAVESENV